MTDKSIDNAIADPKVYARPEEFHALFSRLRKEEPVRWTEPEGYRPFWTVSKHADIMEVERQNDKFLNDPRLTLQTIQTEEEIKKFTGGNSKLIRSLVDMDNPDHRNYRGLTQAWFMPPNLKAISARVDALAEKYIDRLEARGGECDFVADVAVWYPLRVIMTVLGVPEEDEPIMLKLTQELFGATDPDMKRPDANETVNTVTDFFNYFTAMTEDRRKNPKDDVASIIANATIDGQPIGHFEAMGYYIIVATAGHDTTSSTAAGGLLALMQNPDEFAKLRSDPDKYLNGAIDEMIRWTTPVKHFFRTAAVDYELRGQKIKAGDNLLMCYWSANRDEEAFDDPFAFRIERSPNKHLAFGYGAHLCLGQHLAKMEIRALYRELLARLEHIELAGDPAFVEASFVSGLKRLPVRYAMKRKAA
ncbi:cytochrome P450 [uncultured Parvibaculum sp.]|uniref:cytochrome P450 n=1 Tax=uncultured Parvibaculum sp. TaxID=291828 RepID=UPI0030D772B1|tara:strand:- start:33599 stop:34855 length:1257 start_codon:yes stop_codon:yes gene_type:complete